MPLLAGGRLGAPGGDLTDASANALGEAAILVAVGSSGILYNANQGVTMGIGEQIGDLLDLVGDIAGTLTGITNGTIIMSQLTAHDSHLSDVEQTITDNHVLLSDLTSDGTKSLQTVLDAIAAIVPGTGLTQEEHDQLMALVNPDLSGIPAAVWAELLPSHPVDAFYSGEEAGAALGTTLTAISWLLGYQGIPVPDRPFFRVVVHQPDRIRYYLPNWLNDISSSQLPLLDLSWVQDGDTVMDYLTREYPGYAWSNLGPGTWPAGGRVWLEQDPGNCYYYCTLTDADLHALGSLTTINNNTTNITTGGAPVWPGADGVTLGTPVALVDQLHLEGDMDGVIIACTTPPTRTGLRQIGGALYDYGVGEMAFETDSGDLEPWQYLGFRAAIFTPKSMQRAAGARFRVLAGAGGTVTPWVRS